MNTFAPKKLNQFPATKEQIDNMELIKAGNNVKVIAGAGAGKTSSLRYIAKSIPHKNFLVLCFNTANSKESNNHPDKPANVFYSTTHSLAYKSIVTPDFRKKLSFTSVSDLFKYNLVKYIPTKNTDGSLKSKDDIKSGVSILYKSISDTITYFCRSDKRAIAAFADNYLKYTFTEVANVTKQPLILTPLAIAGLVADIVDYWDNLTNPKHVAKISHDIYLKLYDLGEFPVTQVWDDSVRSFVDIDIVCLDECQDTNPVTDAIFRRQLQQKIIIGDPMQAIYEWRGSTDIMALPYYTNFATGYLTESFRFNQSIADMANIILRKAGADMQLIGSGTTTEIITKAHICRTNAAVVETIFKYIGTNAKIYATIDFKETFSKLFHIQSCWFNEVPKYPVKELSHIKNKETLEEAMEVSEDIARLHRLKTALTADGKSLYAAKLSLDKLLVKEAKDATLTVCTIHSSKGLEYDHVTIDQDILVVRKTESVEEALERLWEDHPLCCLLYVAVTRAKVSVTLPDYLEDVLNK
jgi:superfamily I DNA/RNA helicase